MESQKFSQTQMTSFYATMLLLLTLNRQVFYKKKFHENVQIFFENLFIFSSGGTTGKEQKHAEL
jgi:hypothetical protein